MQPRHEPTRLVFESQLENELARWDGITAVGRTKTGSPPAGRRSPFDGYVRTLTEEGGVLITYTDLDCSVGYTILRWVAWIETVATCGWLILMQSSLSFWPAIGWLAALALLAWSIVNLKLKAKHSVEIRADCMIIDGKDKFWADDIGDNWPELQLQDEEDPDRLVIAGTCGTRFVEYMTANRFDECDRTPEVLAGDLRVAMEQLWGRREVTFAATD